jgi:hypothetical protein
MLAFRNGKYQSDTANGAIITIKAKRSASPKMNNGSRYIGLMVEA